MPGVASPGAAVPLLATERVRTFEPVCYRLAEDLLDGLASDVPDLMADFCRPFAARAQCAYLGWPAAAAEQLSQWAVRNQGAIRAQDREAMAALAHELDTLVRDTLDTRRAEKASATDDITAELLAMRVRGRLLTDEELVSVLRNWTAGEVGTLAAAIGIVVHYLAQRPGLQHELRAEPARLPSAIEPLPDVAPCIAQSPACGFTRLPLRLHPPCGAGGARSPAQLSPRSEESA